MPARKEARSKPASVVDEAVGKIRDHVLRGRFVPGQRLIEPELMEQLGISRTTLREAFRRLAAEGVLDLELYRGASVKRITKRDAQETFIVREALEGIAAREAAKVATKPANAKRLRALRKSLRAASKPQTSVADYAQENVDFHQLLVDLADNAQLGSLMEQVQTRVFRMVYSRLLDLDARTNSQQEHEAIFDALLAGDPDAAEKAMRAHIRSSGEAMLRLADDYFA